MSNKLDKFHYHEALHTAHIIQVMIERELLGHPVGTNASKKMRKHLQKAQGHLEAFYQWCGEQGDELE